MLVCFGMPNAVWRQCDVCATAKASDAMLLSGVPIPGCRSPLPLGPTSAFQEIGLGLLPTSASGRATGSRPQSSCTRRASRHLVSSSARAHAVPGGPGLMESARGPHSARRPGRAVRSCIWNWVAASQARCGRPETNAGPLLRAGAACKPVASIGPATGRASPRTVLAGMLVTDPQTRAACASCMLRYQARQLRWRKRRVAAASSGLVSARPTLLGASFACDFDPRVPDAAQVRRRDAACRKLCQMREFNADISVRSCSLWRLTGG